MALVDHNGRWHGRNGQYIHARSGEALMAQPKPKVGSGNFNRLATKLARKGVRNPRGLAATIGRRKYGAGAMAKAAAAGRRAAY